MIPTDRRPFYYFPDLNEAEENAVLFEEDGWDEDV